jgi:hypothetical protein
MNKKLEKLEEDLANLEKTNRSLWGTYSSELCVADMIRKEKELEKRILKLKTINQRKKQMTKFNPEHKGSLTYGECLGPAMKITDPKDAQQYLKNYVAFIQKCLDKEPRKDNMTAEQIAKINLGYFAGYYDDETRRKVEKLFCCSHPIFGSIEQEGTPTAEDAFNAGKKLAKNSQK